MIGTRPRVRLATGLLIAVMIWPPVQHVLARTYDLDPWAFFGWAMYAAPNLRVNVLAARLETPSIDANPDWNAISVGSYGELRSFAIRRAKFGSLLSPDDLARDLFREQPDLPGILIRVTRWEISHETSRLTPAHSDHVYSPPGDRVEIRK